MMNKYTKTGCTVAINDNFRGRRRDDNAPAGFLMLVLLALLLMAAPLRADDLSPYFKRIGVEHGLSHRKVNCIIQDRRGFIWFGTEDGLNRYDGQYFVSYKHSPHNLSTLSGNIITDLYEDEDGILWIATRDGGMTKYDYRLPPGQQFKQYKYTANNPNGIPENSINTIEEDNHGYLWLGSSRSWAVRFNKQTEKFDIPVKKDTKCVNALALTQNDTLWVGKAGGGIMKINTRDLTYSMDMRYDDLYAKLPHVSISSIFKDSQQNLWIASWDKFVYRCTPNNTEIAIDPNAGLDATHADEVVGFAEDRQRRIWMACKNSGLKVYDVAGNRFTHLKSDPQTDGTLSDDHVNAVYIDRNQIVWVATNNGVNQYNPLFSSFKHYTLAPPQEDLRLYDFYKDADQHLWIGTSQGIYLKKAGSATFEHRELFYNGKKLAVTKFYRDHTNELYIGTDYTLFHYDGVTNVLTPLPNTDKDPVMSKVIDSRIVSIVEDSIYNHPVFMVSPYGHFLAYYDRVTKAWVSRQDTVLKIRKRFNILDNLNKKVYKDSRNTLWLATVKRGLGKWQPDEGPITYFTNDTADPNSISSNEISDIQENSEGNLWVSTYGGGLNMLDYRSGRFTHIPQSGNLIEGIQIDHVDNVWMICNGTIHKYIPSINLYSSYDLPRLRNTGGLSGFIYQDQRGNLYAAGNNYYIEFNPAFVASINPEPDVFLTDFKVLNRSYSHYLQQQTVELSYRENIISIEYAAPEFTSDNLQYSYMLEGLDADWIPAGKRNVVQYLNLKGGTYTFKVRAANWAGLHAQKVSRITIVVTPPFWNTVWFYIVVALLLVAIGYGIHLFRMRNLLKQQRIRNEIAQDLHDQIGSTLSSISVYSEVARVYSDQQEKTKLNTVLGTINGIAADMVVEMADIVWAINPKNDHLESVFKRIKDYAQPLCGIRGIDFNFTYDQRLAGLVVDMKTRKNLFLITKESINNTLKHAAGCKHLRVHLRLLGDTAELTITDDGTGFDMPADVAGSMSTTGGNGLTNMKNRAKELAAVLDITSSSNAGTALRLTFRIRPNA